MVQKISSTSKETHHNLRRSKVSFNRAAAEPKKTYKLVLADGTTKTASLNVEHRILTIDGVEYREAPGKCLRNHRIHSFC